LQQQEEEQRSGNSYYALLPNTLLFHFGHRALPENRRVLVLRWFRLRYFKRETRWGSEYWLILVAAPLYQFTMGVDISLQAV